MNNKINIQDIVTIAKEAGNAIMKIYNTDFEVEYKLDNSPLTLADKKSNKVIEFGLNQLAVDIPILSEEGSHIPYEIRKNWEYFWLIDPLDGTKEFVKKNGEFTVNISLIHKDTPILGVVYAPALNVCYWSIKGGGAFKDGERLPIETEGSRDTYKIVVSRSHMSNETQKFIDAIDTNKKKELMSIGSSLKICLVAEGQADIYPRLSPTMEWDTSSAHAIINETNCKLIDYKSRKSLKYNSKNSLINNHFIVQ